MTFTSQQMPFRAKIILVGLALATLTSLLADLVVESPTSWFQRSGAFIVLAGVYLQYLYLVGVWTEAIQAEKVLPSVEEHTSKGGNVSVKEQLEEAVRTRNFVVALHTQVSTRTTAELVAIALILLGTAVASYGDLVLR